MLEIKKQYKQIQRKYALQLKKDLKKLCKDKGIQVLPIQYSPTNGESYYFKLCFIKNGRDLHNLPKEIRSIVKILHNEAKLLKILVES